MGCETQANIPCMQAHLEGAFSTPEPRLLAAVWPIVRLQYGCTIYNLAILPPDIVVGYVGMWVSMLASFDRVFSIRL